MKRNQLRDDRYWSGYEVTREMIDRRLNAIETTQGKLNYLKSLVGFFEKRKKGISGKLINYSRSNTANTQIKQGGDFDNYTLTNKNPLNIFNRIGRRLDTPTNRLVPSERRMVILAKKMIAQLEKEQKVKPKVVKKKIKSGAALQEKKRAIKEKKYSEAHERLNQFRSEFIKNRTPLEEQRKILADRISGANSNELNNQIIQEINEIKKLQAKVMIVGENNLSSLLNQASKEKNPLIRKKIIQKARQQAKKEKKELPLETIMIEKYGELNRKEIPSIREYVAALKKGDLISAIDALRQTSLKHREGESLVRKFGARLNPREKIEIFEKLGLSTQAKKMRTNLIRKARSMEKNASGMRDLIKARAIRRNIHK
ncbi:MAG: hypothetical protein PHQ98_04225 [Candidatus ainarchaeum sp.]|nr:hypothetical protein [Candidatus ainarchaeum sp.]